jgi:hypothetical protein
MTGLSDTNPQELYSQLSEVLTAHTSRKSRNIL